MTSSHRKYVTNVTWNFNNFLCNIWAITVQIYSPQQSASNLGLETQYTEFLSDFPQFFKRKIRILLGLT